MNYGFRVIYGYTESEDAHRNSLNSHCYWLLRKQGKSVAEATNALDGRSVAFKNELLFQNGINFDKLPNWQKEELPLHEEYSKFIEKILVESVE